MEKVIYDRMRQAKTNHSSNFELWLEDILSFVGSSTMTSKEFIQGFKNWREVLESEKGYLEYKDIAQDIIKYASKRYIYLYHMDADTPEKLTNMGRIALNSTLIVNLFNLNFFDQEDPKFVFLGLIEGVVQASKKLHLDPVGMIVRFYRILFKNFNYQDTMQYGPAKTRIFELHQTLSNSKILSHPDGTLKLNEGFYSRLPEDLVDKIRGLLSKETKPELEDYQVAIDLLREVEAPYVRDTKRIIWENSGFVLVRGGNKKNTYLGNKETGVVLKSFELGVPLHQMIAESRTILR